MGKWHLSMDPVQEWGEEVEDGAVFGVTLRREPVEPDPPEGPQTPGTPPGTPPGSGFIQYHTVKVRRLKAASLERLVDHLLDPEHREADFPRVFLATYRAFTPASGLIELLFKRDDSRAYPEGDTCPRSTLGPVVRLWLDEFREDLCEPPLHPALRQLSIQLRHRLRFRRLAQSAESLLRRFQEQRELSNVAVTILVNTALVSHRCLPGGIRGLFASSPFCDVSFVSAHLVQPAVSGADKEAEKPEARGPGGGPGGGPDRPAHLEEGRGFMQFSQKEVAEQLTRLDAALFVRVVPFHCLGCVWSQRDKKENRGLAPSVRATIAQFNAVTNRVITSLLCPPGAAGPASPAPWSSSPPSSPVPPPSSPGSPRLAHSSVGARALVIERWIAIAQECRQLRNFSSLRAILSALQSNAVYRLKKTWGAVSRESMASFELLCTTFPDDNCMVTGREILTEEGHHDEDHASTLPKSAKLGQTSSKQTGSVPYLGTFLTVLTMLDTALTDNVQDDLINFEKRRREFDIISQIHQLQASCSHYRFPVHVPIDAWLQEHALLTDQESYDLSRSLEPPVDPCPSSPSSWSHRLLNKKFTSLRGAGETSSGRKAQADQISVSSSGSSSSETEDPSSPPLAPPPAVLRLKLKTLSGSLHNVAEDFFSSSSSPGSSLSSCSSHPDLSSCTLGGAGGLEAPGPRSPRPVYNQQGADSCIVRVSVEDGNNGNIYKSILLTSQDHTAHVIQRALEKHNMETYSSQDFSLTQLLTPDKELLIPEKANVFYAMSTTANYDFVLRQRWKTPSRPPCSSSGAEAHPE
ncbi:ral guanine nucleotide dissociation stimulator-like 1 [Gadus macrocephalus]|uniref:ral guanine nucleotide dissociation stimulator-like 1 n=1 Tax=Gadus macrocephalus TaxID=80720 RepID=UPI0028CB1483|nr:ral guanine nucleotide dissociation stimulator-like 1 [Gadus macrocephalus]